MARQPRAVFAGIPHLVQLRVQHGQPLTIDTQDADAVRALLDAALKAHRVQLHAYGFDESSVDLVATSAEADALSKAMQAFARRYAAAFNRRHGRRGSLWASRFEAAAIERTPWLLRAMLYVEQSRAGVPRGQSSALHHGGSRPDPLITDAAEYWSLGNTPFEREQRYRAALAEKLPADWRGSFEAALRGGWPLGSSSFLAVLGTQTERRLDRLPAGRPRSI